MTMIEIVVAFAVLGVSFTIYSSATIAVRNQAGTVREMSDAADACQKVVESLRAEPFDTLVARFGRDPDDDPGGAGTAPGPNFAVPGLRTLVGDPDGKAGEIVMPEVEVQNGVWQLREDANAAELGMPRDLNGDSIIDGVDHGQDYFQIPVCVRVRWDGRTGPCKYELFALLVAYRR
ncbi:MAG: hypothetical protein K8S98_19185 [Planctomycetes bacterium]|nr:hypothetical protein [Planctomycetota bacterium]